MDEYKGLDKVFVWINHAVITFWYDKSRVIQKWHTTDWDNAGWSVVKEKASQFGLTFEEVVND